MRRSSTIARLLTILIGVVVAPIAVGLIASGGFVWMRIYLSFGTPRFDLPEVGGPVAVQAVGLLLLALVVATGRWSSAGLIAVGILGLVSLVLSIAPGLLLELYRGPSRVFPREWIDGIMYGIPLLLFPLLGAMGLTLALVRRSNGSRNAGAAIVGIILSPLLLAAGAWLTLWGITNGQMQALRQFQFEVAPVPAAALIGGVLLLIGGVLVARWSTYALVLPAVALVALTIAFLFRDLAFPLRRLLPIDMSITISTTLLLGVGTSTAIAFLVFTEVLRRVRRAAAAVPVLDAGHELPTAYGSPSPSGVALPYAAPQVIPPTTGQPPVGYPPHPGSGS